MPERRHVHVRIEYDLHIPEDVLPLRLDATARSIRLDNLSWLYDEPLIEVTERRT